MKLLIVAPGPQPRRQARLALRLLGAPVRHGPEAESLRIAQILCEAGHPVELAPGLGELARLPDHDGVAVGEEAVALARHLDLPAPEPGGLLLAEGPPWRVLALVPASAARKA